MKLESARDLEAEDYGLALRLVEETSEAKAYVNRVTRHAHREVAVQVVGPVRAYGWSRWRERALKVGCSVGHPQVTAGTGALQSPGVGV